MHNVWQDGEPPVLQWQNLFRVLQIFRMQFTEVLAADLKEVLKNYIDRNADEIFDIMSRETRLGSGTNIKFDLHGVKHHVLEKVGIEIDLYMDSLVQGLTVEEEGAKLTQSKYNFYGPVGAVQTGPGASANVVQNLSTEDKDALMNALDEIKESLKKVEDIATSEKEEIIEIVQESREELQKPKPNNMKIRTILTQVGRTIQTFASMQSAYQLLKSALIPLGIVLP
ncbi:MAG: hypothetical protein ABIL62_16815 [Planctomycetota bacterium]